MPRGTQAVQRAVEAVKAASRPSEPQSLTASARVYRPDTAARMLRKGGNHRARSREWQAQLWDYYDIVPEYGSACDWIGNSLSKARILIYKDGKPLDNQLTRDILAGFFGGVEGQAEMLRLFGVNFSVAGEAWIIGEPGKGGSADQWRIIAATEVTGEDSFGMRHLVIEGERADENVLPIRIWKAHPRRSEEANSPSRRLLSTLAQIVKLSQVIDAQADSRLISAGVLFVPSEIEMPAMTMTITDNDGTERTETAESGQALYQLLVENASIAIEKRDSAAAQVPIVISAPGEYLEKVNHVEFWSGFDEYVKELRDEAIRRIGVGMDMPPEIISGTADMNHWGAWQLEEAAIKSYLEPLLEIVVASLSKGYLHPYLEAIGIADFASYRFFADTSQMRMRPNRSKESVELWDRGVLSTRTMLIENGFDPESDIMPDDEKIMWLLQKVGSGSTTPELVAQALQQLRVPIDAGAVAAAETQEARPTRSLEQHPHRGAPNPDESEAEAAVVASGGAQPFVVDGLVMAAEQMVLRALERAGNRLKNRIGQQGGGAVSAVDLYMSMSDLSRSECEKLLEDAWTTLDRFSYPGCRNEALGAALQSYTMMLLRRQAPMSRASLARHLMMEMSEVAA